MVLVRVGQKILIDNHKLMILSMMERENPW